MISHFYSRPRARARALRPLKIAPAARRLARRTQPEGQGKGEGEGGGEGDDRAKEIATCVPFS